MEVPYGRAAPIFRQILEVLKYVHSEGLDHLSLTPSSILYRSDGQIKLFAVGLTHTLDKELFERIVSAGISPIQIGPRKVRLNSIDMFSPEIRGGQPYRASSDIYGVGVLAYWMLTGRKPSMGKYQSPREHAPDLPGNWDLFLYKSLDTNPKSRYPTVANQLSDFIKINLPAKKSSNRVLAEQLERIPVPKRVRVRGAKLVLAWRLSIIGIIGVLLVGGMAAFLPSIFVEDLEDSGKIAYRALPGGRSDLRFRFQPERVKVEFDDGRTKFIVLDGTLELNIKGGTHKMNVSAPAHRERTYQINKSSVDDVLSVNLAPIWGRLTINGTPGAIVMARDTSGDVSDVGVVPPDGVLELNERVYAGTYDFISELANYESREMEGVTLSEEEAVTLDMRLVPIPAKVEIITQPKGATVYLNGQPIGATPLELDDMPVGQPLEFRTEFEGYRERTQTLTLQPASDVLLDFGNLLMKTGELRPSVTLDGVAADSEDLERLSYRVGGVSFEGTNTILAPIMEGEYVLVVEHPDYQRREVDVRIGDGRFTPVRIDLEPKPGQLTVALNPSLPFALYANGTPLEPIGGAASTFALVPNEPFEIEVRIQDYLSIKRLLTLGPNEREVWQVRPEPIPGPGVGEPYTVPYVAIDLAGILPGVFTMGSPPEEPARLPNEGPQTEVEIGYPYWFGQFEVTQNEFQYVMESNPSFFEGGDHPVDSVSWNDAVAFCGRLTSIESRAGRLPEGYVYRLPTEAEWEYAARAGTTTPFYWGEEADPSDANFKGVYPRDYTEERAISSIYGTVPVGSYAPSFWDIYDVHGNVREWTNDYWNARLPGGRVDAYTGPTSGRQRAFRGGGWEDPAQRARSAERDGLRPTTVSASLGFRIVLAPKL